MNKFFTLLIPTFLSFQAIGQVKASYLYNTAMPYGTLDIRTTISSTNYYYLKENTTFSFRESSPGVRTNTYLDMTSWDSSPYQQGHLRYKNGSKDIFVMNYRLLFPANYNATYAEGYPMIVFMHGAGERANCYYNACYHATPEYSPIINSPPAPKTVTSKLLNNDHNINIGGKVHLDARNLAGNRLPNDPSMPSRAFPGFVLSAQMFNVWDSLQVQDVIRIVQLLVKKYKIDPNRIYVHGLSIGGYATYEAIKRAPWLFAAALPMSAVREAASIFKYNQQGKVIHVPIWQFQGAKDTDPSLTFTNSVINKWKSAGAVVRYTVYSDLSHNVWNRAYGEADFFKWMLSKSKANIHPKSGITVINKSKNQYPQLILAEGFLAYQWEKNGAIISGVTTNTYKVTTPGTYRARFSRISSAPSASQWNKWSAPITITESTTTTAIARVNAEEDAELSDEDSALTVNVYPNPTAVQDLSLQIRSIINAPVSISMANHIGQSVYSTFIDGKDISEENIPLQIPSTIPDGLYILSVRQGGYEKLVKIMVRK